MGFFDPPALKSKALKRPVLKYPKNFKKSRLAWLYYLSVLFWLTIFLTGSIVAVFVLLPILSISVSSLYKWLVIFVAGFLGLTLGGVIASALVNSVIRQGIREGEITFQN